MVKDKYAKKSIILTCDEAFGNHSVCNRSDYDTLLNKIDLLGCFLCAYTEKPLGYLAFYCNDTKDKSAYISLVAVSSMAQKSGVGTRLIMDACSMAIERGMNKIKLEVRKNNSAALRLYEHCGFHIVGNASNESFYMEKFLDVDTLKPMLQSGGGIV